MKYVEVSKGENLVINEELPGMAIVLNTTNNPAFYSVREEAAIILSQILGIEFLPGFYIGRDGFNTGEGSTIIYGF